MVEQLHIGGLADAFVVVHGKDLLFAIGAGIVLDAMEGPAARAEGVGGRVFPGVESEVVVRRWLRVTPVGRVYVQRPEEWFKSWDGAGDGADIFFKPMQ